MKVAFDSQANSDALEANGCIYADSLEILKGREFSK